MKHQIENSIKQDSQGYRKYIGIVVMDSPHKKANGRNTEYHPKQIVFFKDVIVTGVVRFVPTP